MTFDLERARGLRDFLQDDCAEVGDVWGEMIAEIERLRPFEIAARDLDSDLTKIAGERDDQAARIKELERALVDERARYNANEEGFSWEYLARKEPDLQEEYRFIARQELREEGEIGAVVE